MAFMLARKLDAEDPRPDGESRQFVEFDGIRYRVCSACYGTREALSAALGDSRMDRVANDERYDTVVVADHSPLEPLVVREVIQLAAFRALGNSAEA